MGYFEDAEYSLATGKPSPNPSPAANEIRRQNKDASYVQPKDLSATYIPKKKPLWDKKKLPSLHRQEATLSENKENIDPKVNPEHNKPQEEGYPVSSGRRTDERSSTNDRPKNFYGQRWPDHDDVVPDKT